MANTVGVTEADRQRVIRLWNRYPAIRAVKEKRVWEYLGEADKQSIVVGVPQTYPIKPMNGCLISSFLTPTVQKQYTHPNELRYDIDRILEGQEYDVDV